MSAMGSQQMDHDDDDQTVKYSKRTFQREFVYLNRPLPKAPSGKLMASLKASGRCVEISFTRNHSEAAMGRLLLASFPSLLGVNLKRLTFIKSYERGHSMATVKRGLMSGEEIVRKYSSTHKKKIYFHSHQPDTSTATSTSTQATTMVDLTQTSPQNGAATRRLLTAMAQRAGVSHEDDINITAASTCTSNDPNEDQTSDVELDCFITSFAPSSSTGNNHAKDHVKEVLKLDPEVVGDITEEWHFPACFERQNKKNDNCRTEEVVAVIQQLYSLVDCTLPMFLPHTLEEMLWQAREEAAVCLLFLWSEKNVGNCINFLFNFLDSEINKKKCGKFLFWLADSQSNEGMKVQSRYGVGDQMSLLVLVPTAIPQCVEIFSDANVDEKKISEALISAELQCLQLKEQGKTLEARRSLVAAQNKEFEQLTPNMTPQTGTSKNVESREKESQDSTSEEEARDETQVTFGPRSPRADDDLSTTVEDEKIRGGKGKKKKSKRYKNKQKKDKKQKRKAARIPLPDEPAAKK